MKITRYTQIQCIHNTQFFSKASKQLVYIHIQRVSFIMSLSAAAL